MSIPVFPCREIPSHAPHAKLLGIYAQRQEGRYLQRVRVPLGELTAAQWRALAAIARRLTPATPLRITTRQDVELHDLTARTLPEAQAALAAAGLTGFASAGDTARNVTVCTCAGLRRDRLDLRPLAEAITRDLAGVEGISSLPRKFKISLSSCRNGCALPYINDVGLAANPDGSFHAVVAGSLGARPGTGAVFDEKLPARDALPLVVAAVRFFAAHGDREHRHSARLRHVRERMGDEPFMAELRRELAAQRASRDWPDVPLAMTGGTKAAKVLLTFANGDVSPEAADALAELTADPSLALRIAIHHQVAVLGPTEEEVRTRVARLKPLTASLTLQPTIVACPGTRWCSRALADTKGLADRIRAELGDRLPPGKTVCVSGCPNGCAHSAVADIGLIGGRATLDGKSIEVYKLVAGGGKGRTVDLAKPVAEKLTPDQVSHRVARHLQPLA